MTNIEVGNTVHIINRRTDGIFTTTSEATGTVTAIDGDLVWFETQFLYGKSADKWEVEIVSIEKPYVIGGIYEIHRPSRGATLRRRVEGGWQMLNSDTIYTDEQHKGWGDAVQRRVLIIDYPNDNWVSILTELVATPNSPADLVQQAMIAEKDARDA